VIEELRACENDLGLVELGRRVPFRKGDSVRLLEGPFCDVVALFEGVSDERRVIVLLELLGRRVRVRVPQEAVTACVF
jgi:transcriptional antiterminator RfaH